ncbi:MAG: divalent-cation tolerance protein CutA [Nevskiales bacterium]
MPPARYCLVYCTCPNAEAGQRIADHLVGERLAACVNLVPGLRSTYRWKNELCRDEEVLLLIKTRSEHFDALKAAILKLHPYELPEIIAVPVSAGHTAYLDWIQENT